MVIYFIYDFGYSNLLARSYGFNLFYSGLYKTTAFSAGKSMLKSVGILFYIVDVFRRSDRHQKNNIYDIFLLVIVLIYASMILYIFSVRSWLLIDIILPCLLAFHYFRRRVKSSLVSDWICLFFD